MHLRSRGTAGTAAPLTFWEGLALVAVVGLALALRVAFVIFTDSIAEDAFITFRYVRNLIGGLGFVYNRGQPVLGTTTPLFTLLLAALGTLGVSPIVSARVVGGIADAVSVCLVFSTVRRFTRSARWGLFAALVYATNAPAVVWSVSGMETALFTLWLVLALTLLSADRPVGAALAAALAMLTRPEGALLAGVVMSLVAFTSGRDLLRVGGVLVACTAPWLLWAYLRFGDVVPQSVRAKMDLYPTAWGAQHLLYDGVHRLLGYGYAIIGIAILRLPYFVQVALSASAWLTVILIVAGLVLRGPTRPYAAWALFLIVSYALYSRVTLPFLWYWVPLGPLAVVFLVGATADLASIDRPAALRALARACVWVACTAVLLLNAATLAGGFAVSRNVRDYDAALWESAGRWLQSHAPADASVCLEHIGYVGFYSERTIVDTSGLVSPEVVRFDQQLPVRGNEPQRLLALLQSPVIVCDYFVPPRTLLNEIRRVATAGELAGLDAAFQQVAAFEYTGRMLPYVAPFGGGGRW